MKKLFKYLEIEDIGFLELMVALLPILVAYQFGPLPFGTILELFVICLALQRKVTISNNSFLNPLKFLLIIIILHEIILYFMVGSSSPYMLNNIIQLALNLIFIITVTPRLNFNKFKSCIMLIAVISAAGLVYQFLTLQAGGQIMPLAIPFLSSGLPVDRMTFGATRPMSFFMEPSAFFTFMIVPCFYLLNQKRYDLAAGVLFVMLLSGSTNAIVLGFLLFAVYALTQNISKKYRIVIVGVICAMVYLLFNMSIFETGVDKMNNTEFDTSVRMSNGYYMFKGSDISEMILGVPYPSINEYCLAKNLQVVYYGDMVYSTTFWIMLVKFGIILSFAYLLVLYKMIKDCKRIAPYVVCLFVALFSQSLTFYTIVYVFQMISIYSFMGNNINNKYTIYEK